MPIKTLLPCALVALACAFPAAARAADGDKPAAPTASATPASVTFEKPGASWKEDKARGAIKAAYKTPAPEGETEGATVQARTLGPKVTWEKQLEFFCGHYEDAEGKKLEKSAVKQETFEAGGFKVHLGEFAGAFVAAAPRKKADDSGDGEKKAPEKKPNQKTITCLIEGAEVPWAVAIYGTAKAVDAARADFVKYVKSAKAVAEKPAEERKEKSEE